MRGRQGKQYVPWPHQDMPSNSRVPPSVKSRLPPPYPFPSSSPLSPSPPHPPPPRAPLTPQLCNQARNVTQAGWQCLHLVALYHFELLQILQCRDALRKGPQLIAKADGQFPEALKTGNGGRKGPQLRKVVQVEALKAGEVSEGVWQASDRCRAVKTEILKPRKSSSAHAAALPVPRSCQCGSMRRR